MTETAKKGFWKRLFSRKKKLAELELDGGQPEQSGVVSSTPISNPGITIRSSTPNIVSESPETVLIPLAVPETTLLPQTSDTTSSNVKITVESASHSNVSGKSEYMIESVSGNSSSEKQEKASNAEKAISEEKANEEKSSNEDNIIKDAPLIAIPQIRKRDPQQRSCYNIIVQNDEGITDAYEICLVDTDSEQIGKITEITDKPNENDATPNTSSHSNEELDDLDEGLRPPALEKEDVQSLSDKQADEYTN